MKKSYICYTPSDIYTSDGYMMEYIDRRYIKKRTYVIHLRLDWYVLRIHPPYLFPSSNPV